MAKDKLEKKVSIKLTRSLIGSTKDQIKVVRALGLKKTNDVVGTFCKPDNYGYGKIKFLTS